MKIEKLLKQVNGEALVLGEEISRLKLKQSRLHREICEKENELKRICIHNETTRMTTYHAGTKFEKASYDVITVCKLCGIELYRKTSYGKWGVEENK